MKKCSVCGKEIQPERLEILPNTPFCVKCSGSHAPAVVHDPNTLCAKASPSGANGWSPSS